MIRLSYGTGKMEGITSLNTDPLTNAYCEGVSSIPEMVCYYCYSIDAARTYRSRARGMWVKNGYQLQKEVLPMHKLPQCEAHICRIHSHGEVINMNHAVNIMNMVRVNPKTTFSWWTKRPDLVKKIIKHRGKPNNLMLLYSNPVLDRQGKTPKYFDKVVNVWTNDNDKINCLGEKCKDCMLCYGKEHENIKEINMVLKTNRRKK